MGLNSQNFHFKFYTPMLRGEHLCLDSEILSKIRSDGKVFDANWKSEDTAHCELKPGVKAQSYYLPLTFS